MRVKEAPEHEAGRTGSAPLRTRGRSNRWAVGGPCLPKLPRRDDLITARESSALQSVVLRVELSEFNPNRHDVHLRLNGKALPPGYWPTKGAVIRWENAPAAPGINTLSLTLPTRTDEDLDSPRVEKVELFIDYR